MHFRLVPASGFFVASPAGAMRALIVEVLDLSSLRRLCAVETDTGWKILRGTLPTGRLILQDNEAEGLMAALTPWLAKQQVDFKGLPTLAAGDDWARINMNLLKYGALDA